MCGCTARNSAVECTCHMCPTQSVCMFFIIVTVLALVVMYVLIFHYFCFVLCAYVYLTGMSCSVSNTNGIAGSSSASAVPQPTLAALKSFDSPVETTLLYWNLDKLGVCEKT